jgi:CDP-diacylglycerol--glycerol-3-phosphate 3-phosphatidyltransferase
MNLLRFIPNLLSLARLVGGFVVINLSPKMAFIAFIILASTDFFDGYCARKFNIESSVGTWLDPIADKVFYTVIVFYLVWKGRAPLYPFILIVMRDLAIIGFGLKRLYKKQEVKPLWSGKITTCLMFLCIAFSLLSLNMACVMWMITSIMILYSSYDYAKTYLIKNMSTANKRHCENKDRELGP